MGEYTDGIDRINIELSTANKLDLATAVLDFLAQDVAKLPIAPGDDPEFANDKAILDYFAFMKKYLPQADTKDLNYLYGYSNAMTVVEVLKKSGDNLTRENVMKQAASLKDYVVPTLLPGINITTGADDFFPIERMQTARWDGKRWVRFGKVLGR